VPEIQVPAPSRRRQASIAVSRFTGKQNRVIVVLMKSKQDEDPKVKKLRAASDAASIRLEVIIKGTAQALASGFWLSLEELQPLIDIVNIDLVNAAKEYEAALEAYRPFMARRRVHRFRARKIV
jgi:hypothetical protein